MTLNHYAKPVDHVNGLSFDNFILEVCICIFCSMFAVGGYKNDILILFAPNLILAIVCFLLVVINIYSFFKHRMIIKRQEQQEHSKGWGQIYLFNEAKLQPCVCH